MKTTIIAHRCGPDIYPEQTVMSARSALARGADYVEMDIHYTSDGVPVICHDPSAKRMFGVDKLISDMTLNEFMTLRHVADPSYCTHSLENVLDCRLSPILFHCKFSGERLIDLVGHIQAHGAEEQCVLGVLSPSDVELIRQKSADIQTLAFMPGLEQMDGFLLSPVDIIRLWEAWVTPERVEKIHAAGKNVWIMASDPEQGGCGYTTEAKIHEWLALSVDGILLNDMNWAAKVLNNR